MFHVKQRSDDAASRGAGDAEGVGSEPLRERVGGAGPDRAATPDGGASGDGAATPESADGAATLEVGSGADLLRIAADGHADAALVVYREQLARFRRTLDLMSDRGYAELEAKMAEAERYAAAIGRLAAPAGAVLDLGTGAGLPGVVVAARLAPRRVWWVERRRRRAAFLDQVAARAGLREVRVAAEDVRSLDVVRTGRVVAVTAQAVAALQQVAVLTRHLWADDVLLVSRKGPGWEGEVDALRAAAAGWGAYGASASVEVVVTEALGSGGTLVAVRVRGGSACPPSA
jgi:16S rRNA (guanine527-N7)-methyltransferase